MFLLSLREGWEVFALSGPNLQQQQVIDVLDGDVYVSAGAGTGKTYTLTRRIVAAVVALIDAGEVDPLPIDRVMAITFTKAAAAELRFRIRGALAEEAKRSSGKTAEILESCALGVDNAWISTIHSMAGRILRENAIAFNIDPSFATLPQQEAEALELEALQFAMRAVSTNDDPSISRLMASYPAVSHSSSSIGVSGIVSFLKDRAKVMDGGLDSFKAGSAKPSAQALKRLAGYGRLVLATLESDGWSDADRAKLIDASPALESALEKAEVWLSSAASAELNDPAVIDSYLDAVHSFPPTTDKFGSRSKEHCDLMEDYRAAYRLAATASWSLLSASKMNAVLKIARIADAELLRLKSIGGTSLDEDDLLSRCYAELSNPANASIADRYRRQFVYLMIDEFQDTDRLQMKLISLLDSAPGEKCNNLGGDGGGAQESAAVSADSRIGGMCTVGDVQQSIYRFRGADVDVSISRRASLESSSGEVIPLFSNYRSHSSVLQATELVFSQPSVFGDSFLKLDAERVEGEAKWCDSSFSRVSFQFVHSDRKSKRAGKEGVSSEERLVVSARLVATRFKDLAERGVSPSKMAILLGKMTNADVYSQALREVGIESVIAGGSVFSDTQEAILVGDLLRYAADPHDDMALLKLLLSPLFSVSDDVLLALVRPLSEGHARRRRLSEALLSADLAQEQTGLEADGLAALDVARASLESFRIRAQRGDIVAALRGLFMDSGLLYRLQAQDDATAFSSAGNIAKALRIVSDIQRCGCGVAEASAAYDHHLEYEKESPGVLSRSSSEFVKIMTVHSSKGLEFDHVAVADLKDGMVQRCGVAIENIGDFTYAALSVVEGDFPDKETFDNHKKVMGFFSGRLDECGSRVARLESLDSGEASEALRGFISEAGDDLSELVMEHMRAQELQEARRLLYVAMTRARESLLLVHSQSGAPSVDCYKGIYGDIHSALSDALGGIDAAAGSVAVRSGDISFGRRFLVREEMDAEELDSIAAFLGGASRDDASEPKAFEVPVYPDAPDASSKRFSISSSRLRSYSSLASNLPFRQSVSFTSIGEGGHAEGSRDEDATALGMAFHHLAQMLIDLQAGKPACDRKAGIPDDALKIQSGRYGLTDSQIRRLKDAFDLWMSSAACREFLAHDRIAAEVSFSVPVEVEIDGVGLRSFALEGEMDGLAADDDGTAYLIDYKTGVSPDAEDVDALLQKHLFQAQCYAFALLSNGFDRVCARFVRIEDVISGDDGNDVPVLVDYSFDSGDVGFLREVIVDAWLYPMQHDE